MFWCFKDDIEFEWVSRYSSGFIAKAIRSKYEEHLRETINYTIYLAFSVLGDKVYETVILGSSGSSFEDESLFIINSLVNVGFSDRVVVSRYGLGLELVSDWLLRQTGDRELVNLVHKDKEAFLIVSCFGVSGGISLDIFVSEQLDSFKFYLDDEKELDYYYDIKDLSILGKRSLLVQVFGELGGEFGIDSVELRRYYFEHSGRFYLIELWYNKGDKDALEVDFKGLMSKIRFIK